MISVIIPLYNKAGTIQRTIESVLCQTFVDFEIIVVNDGSTDNSAEVIKNITDNRIRIISHPNKGVSYSRNHGVNESKGELIALLDADDCWERTFLEEMNNLVSDFPGASLYGSSWEFITPAGQRKSSVYGLNDQFRGYIDNYFDTKIYNTYFNSSSVIFRKSDFIDIGMFDESLKIGEDIDLWFRFALSKRLAFVNKVLSYYNLGSENRSSLGLKAPEQCLINNLQKYKDFEEKNKNFKNFLDIWRLHNITDYFENRRTEISGVKPILREMDLGNFAMFWSFLLYSPGFLHKRLYKIRKLLINSGI